MTFELLVLDDEPWQLSWVTDVAAHYGGSCTFASTYDDATRAFAKTAPAIVLVDIRIGDADVPPQGATLASADSTWVGLRFLRHVRVEAKSASTILMVYTGLDREDLQRIVTDSYQALFFTKFESSYFRRALIGQFEKIGRR